VGGEVDSTRDKEDRTQTASTPATNRKKIKINITDDGGLKGTASFFLSNFGYNFSGSISPDFRNYVIRKNKKAGAVDYQVVIEGGERIGINRLRVSGTVKFDERGQIAKGTIEKYDESIRKYSAGGKKMKEITPAGERNEYRRNQQGLMEPTYIHGRKVTYAKLNEFGVWEVKVGEGRYIPRESLYVLPDGRVLKEFKPEESMEVMLGRSPDGWLERIANKKDSKVVGDLRYQSIYNEIAQLKSNKQLTWEELGKSNIDKELFSEWLVELYYANLDVNKEKSDIIGVCVNVHREAALIAKKLGVTLVMVYVKGLKNEKGKPEPHVALYNPATGEIMDLTYQPFKDSGYNNNIIIQFANAKTMS